MQYVMVILVTLLALMGCSPKPTTETTVAKPATALPVTTVHTTIQGTRLQPDPVEAKLHELEQAGQLKILRTLESYPLQFEIETTGVVLEQIQTIIATANTNKAQ